MFFLLYQKEYIPKIDPKVLYQYIEMYQDRPDISQTINGVFEFYRRDVSLDTEKIRQAFAIPQFLPILCLSPPLEKIWLELEAMNRWMISSVLLMRLLRLPAALLTVPLTRPRF